MPTKIKGKLFINESDLYSSIFEDRNVTKIAHFSTPKINYPDEEAFPGLNIATHVWKQGDKFYKLSQEFYGSTKHWWVIPWFNQKPLESDYKYGDKIFVPLDLNVVLSHF